MGVLQRFERRLGGLVEGAFAKVFKGGVEPVEIAGALARECDDRRAISAHRTLVPNQFVVELSSRDYERLGPYEEPLGDELAAMVREHAADQRYTFVGPVTVHMERSEELDVGVFRIRSLVQAAPDAAGYAGYGRPGGPAAYTAPPPYSAGYDRAPPPAPAPPARPRPRADGRPRLVLVSGGAGRAGGPQAAGVEREYELNAPVTVIGRSVEADVRLSDTGVSRRHGEIRRLPDGRTYAYTDLGSTNGTVVNGRPATEVRLEDGDRIEVGSTALVFRRDESPRDGADRRGGEPSDPPWPA